MTTAPAAEGVSAAALVQAAGITYRQLDYWTRHGHLATLPGASSRGSGRERRYPTSAVYEARLMGQLVHVIGGVRDLSAIADIARRLAHTGRADVRLGPDRVLRLTILNGAPA